MLLGSIASIHGDQRWWFGAGAAAGSVAWFTALGRGAALLRALFARAAASRVLDGAIAAVMLGIAVTLLRPCWRDERAASPGSGSLGGVPRHWIVLTRRS